MEQQKYIIELQRKSGGKYLAINKKEVYEFDDECRNFNLWSQGCDEFKKEIKAGDIIRIGFERSWGNGTLGLYEYQENGSGKVLYESWGI